MFSCLADGLPAPPVRPSCARGPVRTMAKASRASFASSTTMLVVVEPLSMPAKYFFRAAFSAAGGWLSAPPSAAVRPRRSRKASSRVVSCPGAVSV
ncbi:MAG: hypothetical protein ACLUHE_14185 [Christensenellales bacterium]